MTLGEFPELTWSLSAARTAERCLRRYYHDRYGAWAGWAEDAPGPARRAYRLKQLTSLDMAFGRAIHRRAFELVEMARSRREPPSAEALRRRTRRELGVLYRTDREVFEANPKGSPMLQSAYYRDGPSPRTLEGLREKLRLCVPNLRDVDLWARIRERQDQVLYVEDPDSPFAPPELEVHGVGVFARPDLVLRDLDEDTVTVVEWKTGLPREEDLEQVHVYGLWAREVLGAEECSARIVYLRDGSSRREPLTGARLDAARERIAAGVERLRELLADEASGRPRPASDFPLTAERWRCRRCNFFALCEAELRESGELPWESAGAGREG